MSIHKKRHFEGGFIRRIIIAAAFSVSVYLLVSLFFINHCFFNTVINGVNVSLKAHMDVDEIIRESVKDYKLQLVERNDEIEEITGQDIDLQYNEKNSISKVYRMQKSYKWISSLLKKQKYHVKNLFTYDTEKLENEIKRLNCLNKTIIEPRNVSFKYSNGAYEVIEEVYGNKIIRDRLNELIKICISKGISKLNLSENFCYENPQYTIRSDKTLETRKLLDKYVSTKISYIFGDQKEVLDGDIINKWLSVDENLDVVIDEKAVREYIRGLGKKYDTVGAVRKFKTSVGKIVEVKGGYYGWKINRDAEAKALFNYIKYGTVLEKEPIYIQKALTRDKDDIGSTYVEISITRQHLWFYKNGRLLAHGAVVTGNPNRGYSTETGVYMLNYKENGSTLRGPDYEVEVNYWMPFNGNIGIHDASWRYSFGGDIYKRNGTHGCVNVSLFLAKRIYDNIEDGTPVICYEEQE
ncbi:MAG: peptidoglycan binding domain-containing protein [Bacillota bacterium]